MFDSILPTLRCPIDPLRESGLTRDEMTLVCQCKVKFPIRQGLPILLSTEAELPTGCPEIEKLPCVQRRRNRVR
jgi:uncharacterized protein